MFRNALEKICFGAAVSVLAVAAMASPAGVIPYACVDGSALVLMAYDPAPGRLGYGAFGGGKENNESIAETAAREFHEETRCTFSGPAATDLELLPNSNSDGFYSWVAEVPYISALFIGQHACDAAVERAGWQWFELDELLTALKTESDRPVLYAQGGVLKVEIWDKAAQSLRQAVLDDLLDSAFLCRK